MALFLSNSLPVIKGYSFSADPENAGEVGFYNSELFGRIQYWDNREGDSLQQNLVAYIPVNPVKEALAITGQYELKALDKSKGYNSFLSFDSEKVLSLFEVKGIQVIHVRTLKVNDNGRELCEWLTVAQFINKYFKYSHFLDDNKVSHKLPRANWRDNTRYS